jgi:hypothetical protein
MATPSEKLAESLKILREFQDKNSVAIQTSDLTRTHRERLLKNGFLQQVMKGWYIPLRPSEAAGDSTSWYASYWSFCSSYLKERFGTDWCLSPEQSLSLHAGNKNVPHQLLVRSTKARNSVTNFMHGTSLLDVRYSMPDKNESEETENLRVYSLIPALLGCAPGYFKQNPTDMRAALSMVRDASDVLDRLLEGGHSTIAGRLAGAFRNIGRDKIADDILQTMRAADYDVRENDPFEERSPIILPARETSPHVNRIRIMWQEMRGKIIENFPKAPGLLKDKNSYLKNVEEQFITDAYHSLSIEGYSVSKELIERVQSGTWNPDLSTEDRAHRDALAARGYWQAFQTVEKSLEKLLQGKNSGVILNDDHGIWYREMFAPSVTAGILKPADLAGYRNGPVYIRRSMHVPPNKEAVRDLMPAFFDLLAEDENPAVCVVLGHFIFVYIHPYMDGNGRMGRFLMNVMLASGGYPWTVIPFEKRNIYMAALEEASVNQNIAPFTDFLATLLNNEM